MIAKGRQIVGTYSTRIKDADIAIRHSRGCTFSILQALEMGWGMWALCDTKLTLRKRYVSLTEKCSEDARQDEKHVPDLLESIMRPTDPVKEELRQKLFKMSQFGSKIKKHQGFKILDSGISNFSRRRPTQPSRPVGFKQETAFQTRINSKHAGFKRRQALLTVVLCIQ